MLATISKDEQKKIRAWIESGVYLGNIFSFCAKEHFSYIEDYFTKVKEISRAVSDFWSMAYDLKENIKSPQTRKEIDEATIKSIKKVKEDKQLISKEESLLMVSIKLWFERNLIVQVQRPSNYGNKGDYGFRNRLLFAKFRTREEYEAYIDLPDNYETYERWYNTNYRYFFKLTRTDVDADGNYIEE